MAENFFSIPKTKRIHRQKINSFDDARFLIDEFIFLHNNDSIQLKTKLTPLEKRCQHAWLIDYYDSAFLFLYISYGSVHLL